ncbi:MAG: hypothetical protein O7D86_04165 [Proteobacteria bacterium]|nr:hypothetical protein [Pseudomonadota bacterium]
MSSYTKLITLSRIVDLLSCYSTLWKKLTRQEFTSSWDSLQDSLDLLRLIKKFLDEEAYNNFRFFEYQLKQLERLYPYHYFFSMGATINWVECNICGKDMDSMDCDHLRGELY